MPSVVPRPVPPPAADGPSAADATFDRVCRLASRLLGVPAAFVTFFEGDRYVVAGAADGADRARGADPVLCRHVATRGAVLAVPDAAALPGPLAAAVGGSGFGAYLGVPLAGPDGCVRGALCVIAAAPRAWTGDEREALAELTPLVTQSMAFAAATDQLGREARARADAEAWAAAALRRSEARYRGILEAIPDLFLRLSREGRYLDVAAPEPAHLAYDEADVVGRTVADSIPEPQATQILGAVGRALDTGAVQVVEYALVRADGQGRQYEARLVPVAEDEVQAVIRDVTERHAAARALREREVLFRSFVEATAQVVWRADPGGEVTELSDAWARFTGQTPAETAGWGWTDAVHPDDVPGVIEGWSAAIAARAPYEVEYRVRSVAGPYHRFAMRAVPVADGAAFLGWVGTCTDVEATRRDEEALGQRERLLSSVAEALGHLLSDDLAAGVGEALRALGEGTGADRVYVGEFHADPATGAALSSQRYEWTADGVSAQVDNPDLQDVPIAEAGFGRWSTELGAGRPIAGAVRELPASERPLLEAQAVRSVLAVPVRVDGATWGFVGFDDCQRERAWTAAEQATLAAAASSIGEALQRQRRQAALAESEERLRMAFEAAGMGSWDADLVGKTVTGSPEALALLDPDGGPLTRSLSAFNALIHPDDRAGFWETSGRALDGPGQFVAEYRAAGTGRWFRSIGRLFTDDRGVPIRARGVLLDIVREKAYEAGLLEAAAAAEAGRAQAEEAARMKSALLANISHEIRTPLTSIIGFADILAEEVRGDDDCAEYARLIGRGGRRLLETLTSVLDLAQIEAGRRELDLARIDARDVVAGTAEMLRPAAEAKGVAFVCDLPDAPAPVLADAGALSRVLTNLAGNAVKFTPAGEVRLALAHEGGAVVIRVADTGVGMSEAFLPLVFDEFRQESEGHGRRFEGNGLGLAITKRLVEMLGGTVAAESVLGEGSTFTVRLPLAG